VQERLDREREPKEPAFAITLEELRYVELRFAMEPFVALREVKTTDPNEALAHDRLLRYADVPDKLVKPAYGDVMLVETVT